MGRDRGLLEQIDRGLYRLVDALATELSSLPASLYSIIAAAPS